MNTVSLNRFQGYYLQQNLTVGLLLFLGCSTTRECVLIYFVLYLLSCVCDKDCAIGQAGTHLRALSLHALPLVYYGFTWSGFD